MEVEKTDNNNPYSQYTNKPMQPGVNQFTFSQPSNSRQPIQADHDMIMEEAP